MVGEVGNPPIIKEKQNRIRRKKVSSEQTCIREHNCPSRIMSGVVGINVIPEAYFFPAEYCSPPSGQILICVPLPLGFNTYYKVMPTSKFFFNCRSAASKSLKSHLLTATRGKVVAGTTVDRIARV